MRLIPSKGEGYWRESNNTLEKEVFPYFFYLLCGETWPNCPLSNYLWMTWSIFGPQQEEAGSASPGSWIDQRGHQLQVCLSGEDKAEAAWRGGGPYECLKYLKYSQRKNEFSKQLEVNLVFYVLNNYFTYITSFIHFRIPLRDQRVASVLFLLL